MKWSIYFGLFSLSTFKFMFAPLAGKPLNLSFLETYLACVSGAFASALFFFLLSDFFIRYTATRRKRKIQKALNEGKKVPRYKNFTFANKLIVRLKRLFGIYVICLFVPLFFSIPGGSIICAKFYGKDKRTFPLIVAGILLNGFITTSIAYSIL